MTLRRGLKVLVEEPLLRVVLPRTEGRARHEVSEAKPSRRTTRGCCAEPPLHQRANALGFIGVGSHSEERVSSNGIRKSLFDETMVHGRPAVAAVGQMFSDERRGGLIIQGAAAPAFGDDRVDDRLGHAVRFEVATNLHDRTRPESKIPLRQHTGATPGAARWMSRTRLQCC